MGNRNHDVADKRQSFSSTENGCGPQCWESVGVVTRDVVVRKHLCLTPARGLSRGRQLLTLSHVRHPVVLDQSKEMGRLKRYSAQCFLLSLFLHNSE